MPEGVKGKFMAKEKEEQVRKLQEDTNGGGQGRDSVSVSINKRVVEEGAEEDTGKNGTPEGAPAAGLEEGEAEEREIESIDEAGVVEKSEEERIEEGEIAALKEELAAKQREIETLRSQLVRLQADFDNYRKRVRREQQEAQEKAAANLIRELLPVLDNLGWALETGRAGGEKGSLLTGIEMVSRQLWDILHRQGLTEVEAVGQPFNPAYHEAVATEETEDVARHNLVMAELRKGYFLHGRLLRPALVKVAVAGGSAVQEGKGEEREEKIPRESEEE